MTLRRGSALIALNTGYREDEVDNMTYLFYKDIIAELAIQFQFETVVHLLGKDYSDESVMELVNSKNPMMYEIEGTNKKSEGKVTLGALQSLGLIK